MKFVKRKAKTAKAKETNSYFEERKRQFLEDVVNTVQMEEIPADLIINWDQTGIRIVPSSSWTMALCGSKRVEIKAKRQITALFCGNILGDFLPIQVIYKGKTNRCHPKFDFPLDWDITHSPRHWSTEETMVQYIKNIIFSYVTSTRELLRCNSPALVIIDNFKGQVSTKINELLESHDIHTCLLPPNTTDRLQPLDIAVNKPAKDYMRQKFDEWYSEQITRQLNGRSEEEIDNFELEPINLSMVCMKEVSADWLVQMFTYLADNPQFLVNGFLKSGINAALDGCLEDDNSMEDEVTSDNDSDSDDDDNSFIDDAG